MKRTLAVLIAVAMIAVAAGCAGKGQQMSRKGNKTTTGAGVKGGSAESGGKYKIGFVNASISSGQRVKMRDMLVTECENLGVELVEVDAHDDVNTQNSNIEAMLQQGLDTILITPCVGDAVNPGVEATHEGGILVIIFGHTYTTEDYTHFVGYSDKQNSTEYARVLVEALTGRYGEPRGSIIVLNTITGSNTDSFQKEGQDSVFSQYPDIKIIAGQYTDFEVSKDRSFVEDCLAKFGSGEVDGFISQDGGMTLRTMDAINEARHDRDNIIFTNTDGTSGVVKLIQDRSYVEVTQFPRVTNVNALHITIACIEGADPEEKDIMVDSIVITKDNADEYLIPNGDDYDWAC